MPAPAQGIRKITVIKKQTGLGVPAIGAGGQILRRKTSVFTAPRDMFENDEIVSHHMSTGSSYGLMHATGKIDGLLSAGTYKLLFAALLEKDFVAGVSAAGVGVTIAGAGPIYTVTRAAGSYLTDGFKIGDTIRLTVGALNANNISKNLWIVGLTATVASVIVVNQSTLTAEGPIAGTTVAVQGKKTFTPLTGHTNDYFTVEEFYQDTGKSELFTDMKVSTIVVTIPATGNMTVSFDMVGRARSRSGVQQLTSPSVETGTKVMASVSGAIFVNGVQQSTITGLTFTLANGAADMGAVVGSNQTPDIQKGRIQVSGQFTGMFDSDAIQTIYDAEAVVSVGSVSAGDKTATADTMAFSVSALKLTGDAPDDGEKVIVRTYPFTGEVNNQGGAALANDQTIVSVDDSAA